MLTLFIITIFLSPKWYNVLYLAQLVFLPNSWLLDFTYSFYKNLFCNCFCILSNFETKACQSNYDIITVIL